MGARRSRPAAPTGSTSTTPGVALRHTVLGADRFPRAATLTAVTDATAAVLPSGGPAPEARQGARHMVAAADELAAGRFRCAAGIGPVALAFLAVAAFSTGLSPNATAAQSDRSSRG